MQDRGLCKPLIIVSWRAKPVFVHNQVFIQSRGSMVSKAKESLFDDKGRISEVQLLCFGLSASRVR